ncbi:hypothetical protein F5X97DRAFT_286950 [Nemania serpens]|nr:hypothetical protein F5X97DRAFT_286950 [Nemania serpens]
MADDFQDMAERAEERSRAGRGGRHRGGGRRGGAGGGGGGSLSRQVQISKALSTLLRHQAQNAGIQLDAEGFAPLDRVVSDTQLSSFSFPPLSRFSDCGFIYEYLYTPPMCKLGR